MIMFAGAISEQVGTMIPWVGHIIHNYGGLVVFDNCGKAKSSSNAISGRSTPICIETPDRVSTLSPRGFMHVPDIRSEDLRDVDRSETICGNYQ